MDDPLRGEIARARHDGVAFRAEADRIALPLDRRATLAADRAGHPRAELQRGVGRVDDRVDGELCDVAFDDLDTAQPSATWRSWPTCWLSSFPAFHSGRRPG